MSRRSRSLPPTPTLRPITDEHKEWVRNLVRQSHRAILAMNIAGFILGVIVGTVFGVVDGLLAGVLVGCFVLLLANVLIIRIWNEWRREAKYLKELEETPEPPSAEVIPPPPSAPHHLRRGRGRGVWRR